jgi:integrase
MGVKLLKKTGCWRVKARVRYCGKILQKQCTLPPGRMKEDAKALLEQIKKDLRHGQKNAVCSLKLPIELFKDILRVYREKSPHAPFSEKHEAAVDKLDNDLGNVIIEAFPDRFEEYLKLIMRQDSPEKKPKSSATHNRPIEIARAAFNICHTLGHVSGNPITRARFPKMKETPRDVSLSEDERGSLIEVARKNRHTVHIADALNYFLQVPCRKSEIVRMKVRDIDLFSKGIRIRNGTTKNEQGVDKPIPPNMLDFFTKRVKESKSPEEPVFCRVVKGSRKDREGREPRIMPLGDFKTAWRTVRKDAGLPGLRIHDTRHVSATTLIDNGTPEQVVMMVAGWKTNMLRTYYHRNPKKSFSLIQFSPKREHSVNTPEAVQA